MDEPQEQSLQQSPRLMPLPRIAFWAIILTLVLELVTVVLRFGFQLESTRDTASTIGRFTFGIRIHHGYCGILIIIVAWIMTKRFPRAASLGWILGIALLASDAVHHFLVLWPITGSPHFDLVYPQ